MPEGGQQKSFSKRLFGRGNTAYTEQAYFYGAGLFLRSCRRRPVSTEKAYFYGAGLFLRRAGLFLRSRPISTTSRPVSTEQAYFYDEQAYFYGAGLFLRSRPVSTEQAYISTKSVRVFKNEKMCPLWATVRSTRRTILE